MLRRQTHHFCAKCKMNLREYRQKECDKCKSNLLVKESIVNESNQFIHNCQDNESFETLVGENFSNLERHIFF